MRITAIGYGAGDHDFKEHANVAARHDRRDAPAPPKPRVVSVLEANIDDSSPQVLGYAMERLLEAGALDVTLSRSQMKKEPPRHAAARASRARRIRKRLAQMIFAETSTLGLRIYTAERRVQARRMGGSRNAARQGAHEDLGARRFAPEYEDCRALAARIRRAAEASDRCRQLRLLEEFR